MKHLLILILLVPSIAFSQIRQNGTYGNGGTPTWDNIVGKKNLNIAPVKRSTFDSLAYIPNDSTLKIKAFKITWPVGSVVSSVSTDTTLDIQVTSLPGGSGANYYDSGTVKLNVTTNKFHLDHDSTVLVNQKVYGYDVTDAKKGWYDAATINLTSIANGDILKYQNGEWVNKKGWDFFQRINSDYTATNTISEQSIFPAATDRVTLDAATTYEFELFMWVTSGATTTTKGLSFNGGTCTFTDIAYFALGQNVAVNTTGTAQSTAYVNQAAVTTILATGTTSWMIRASGTFRINASGTFLPQFKFSADPTGTILVKAGTYIGIRKIADAATNNIGGWN